MHCVFEDVNDAFYQLVDGIHSGEIRTERVGSRVGDVLQVQEPVIITYQKPRQRVLLNPARDGNCFFTLYEALWMLAGRNDVAPLAYYSSKIADMASDDGVKFNAAYGYRWSHARAGCGVTWADDGDAIEANQLSILVDHLKAKPESRRAVLSMWNVEDDLLKIDVTKDVCCNLSVCFSIRKGVNTDTTDFPSKPCNVCGSKDRPQFKGTCNDDHCCEYDLGYQGPRYLDMTVFNRSNDLILGMLGANVVHFSMLQEYVANCLGVQVGLYHQISNNLHCYINSWKAKEWLDWYDTTRANQDYWEYPGFGPNLCENQERFDLEVAAFVESHHKFSFPHTYSFPGYEEPFLASVAWPMCMAFAAYKEYKDKQSLFWMKEVKAPDWRRAGTEWIERRLAKKART
jgi:thymidylate synthase